MCYLLGGVQADGCLCVGCPPPAGGQGRVNDLAVRRVLELGEDVLPRCDSLRRFSRRASSPELAPFQFFQVTLPNGVKYTLLARRASEQTQIPSELRAIGASGGAGLWLNSAPGTGSTLTLLPDGTMLMLTVTGYVNGRIAPVR